MEWVGPKWRLPNAGYVKVNVSGVFHEEPLANGNVSGIGVVVRNHRGKILRLVSGSLRIEERRINELYAMLEGLKHAYLMEEDLVQLETDNVAAHWEWRNSMRDGAIQAHSYVLQQLNQREEDDNLHLLSRSIDEDANELARYLAFHGAVNYTFMVIKRSFGRVHEIWSHDMGLGPVGPQFMAIREDDLATAEANVVDEGGVNEDLDDLQQ